MLRARPRQLAWLMQLGIRPTDTRDERLRKQALVLTTLLITVAATAYVVVYLLLGLPASAAIPFTYQVISIIGLAVFARSGDLGFLRFSQLGAMLILPFALQWTLGGFVNGSAVMVWAFVAPLAALALYPARKAIWFFVGYLLLTLFSAAIDPLLSARAPDIPDWVQL